MAVVGKVGLVILLACLTMRQQEAWRSERALWEEAVAVAPQSPRAAMNLSRAWFLEGRFGYAVRWLGRAADLAPRHRDPANFERLVQLRVRSLESLGVPACQNLSLLRFC